MKETGPVPEDVPIEQVIHQTVQVVVADVRDALKGILQEYGRRRP